MYSTSMDNLNDCLRTYNGDFVLYNPTALSGTQNLFVVEESYKDTDVNGFTYVDGNVPPSYVTWPSNGSYIPIEITTFLEYKGFGTSVTLALEETFYDSPLYGTQGTYSSYQSVGTSQGTFKTRYLDLITYDDLQINDNPGMAISNSTNLRKRSFNAGETVRIAWKRSSDVSSLWWVKCSITFLLTAKYNSWYGYFYNRS